MIDNEYNFTYNGVNLAEALSDESDIFNDYFIVNSVYGRGVVSVENSSITALGMDGAYTEGSRTPSRILEIGITIKAKDSDSLRKKIELLNEILYSNEDVPITFDDEPGRTYFGRLDVVHREYETGKIYQATIRIRCGDPYKYGEEKTLEFQSDSIIVENKGTAETEPIFELTAKESTTFAMVSNGEEYMMVGRPLSDEDEAYEPITNVLDDPMNSLTGWVDGTNVDNGVVSGVMAAGSNGFYASDFGTGTGWYGPAKKRALPEILQDFEAQVQLENLNLNGQMGMIEVYFLDVNDNIVAKLGIEDAWKDVARMQAKLQLGNPSNRHSIYGQPARHSHWYNYQGIMRVARRGQEWTAYFAINQDGFLRYPYLMKFTDFDNEYQTPIAQVQVAIRRRTAEPTIMRVKHVSVNEINHEPEAVPYVANPGDKIIFDHQTGDVYINGEPVPFDFGADFFTLKKGQNGIAVLPENAFDTKLRFREKFR